MLADDLELEGVLRVLRDLDSAPLHESTALQHMRRDAEERLKQMLIDRRVLRQPPCWKQYGEED